MPTMLPSQNDLLYLSTPQVGNELTCSANMWQVSKPKASLPIENQLGRKYLMIKSLPLVCPQPYKIPTNNCRGVKEIKLNSAYKAYIKQPEAMWCLLDYWVLNWASFFLCLPLVPPTGIMELSVKRCAVKFRFRHMSRYDILIDEIQLS